MEAKDKIQLELSVVEVNTILDALAEQPFKEVYALIESIHKQAKAQK